MTKCVYSCVIEFYIFFLDKIHVGGPKLVYEYIWVVNIQANIPKGHPSVLEEGLNLVPKTVQGNPQTNGNQRLVDHSTTHWWYPRLKLNCGREGTKDKPQYHTTD